MFQLTLYFLTTYYIFYSIFDCSVWRKMPDLGNTDPALKWFSIQADASEKKEIQSVQHLASTKYEKAFYVSHTCNE